MALPPAATVSAVTDVAGLIDLMGMQDGVWRGFVGQVGDPGTNIGHLAALPAQLIQRPAPMLPCLTGAPFVPIHASQVGLVWRWQEACVFSQWRFGGRLPRRRTLGLRAESWTSSSTSKSTKGINSQGERVEDGQPSGSDG